MSGKSEWWLKGRVQERAHAALNKTVHSQYLWQGYLGLEKKKRRRKKKKKRRRRRRWWWWWLHVLREHSA